MKKFSIQNISDRKAILFCVGIAVIALFLNYNFFHGKRFALWQIDIDRYADFGQFFSGVLTPILMALTIFLIYKTYDLQKNELKAQRQILDDQVKSTQKSIENSEASIRNTERSLEVSKNAIHFQNFFHALDYITECRNNYSSHYSSGTGTVTFIEAIRGYYNRKKQDFGMNEKNLIHEFNNGSSDVDIHRSYSCLLANVDDLVKAILNAIILALVVAKDSNSKEIPVYLESYLTDYEISLLYYYLSVHGSKEDNLIGTMNEMNLTRNIPKDSFLSPVHLEFFKNFNYSVIDSSKASDS